MLEAALFVSSTMIFYVGLPTSRQQLPGAAAAWGWLRLGTLAAGVFRKRMLRWAGGLRVQLARLAALLQPGRKVGRRTPQGSTQRVRDVSQFFIGLACWTWPPPLSLPTHTHTSLQWYFNFWLLFEYRSCYVIFSRKNSNYFAIKATLISLV